MSLTFKRWRAVVLTTSDHGQPMKQITTLFKTLFSIGAPTMTTTETETATETATATATDNRQRANHGACYLGFGRGIESR